MILEKNKIWKKMKSWENIYKLYYMNYKLVKEYVQR